MACCSSKTPLISRESNWQTRLIQRIARFHDLKLDLEVIGQLCDKFQTFSTSIEGVEVCEELQFKELIGSLGNYYIGTRIYHVVLELSH